jgi:hypothetical protein
VDEIASLIAQNPAPVTAMRRRSDHHLTSNSKASLDWVVSGAISVAIFWRIFTEA